jgi:hypothetical protein
MKKELTMAMAACALMMAATSCEHPAFPDDEQDGECVVNVSLAEWQGDYEQIRTRAAAQSMADLGMTDVWAMVYDEDGACVQTVHQQQSDDGFGSIQLRLKFGSYVVRYVASRGQGAALDADAHTITWAKVSDTLWGSTELELEAGDDDVHVQALLSRVVAKVKIKVNDVIPQAAATISLQPEHWYYGLDYTTGAPTADDNHAMQVAIPSQYLGTSSLSVSFFSLVGASAWDNRATITIADADGHALGVAGIAGVTMQRNVSANFSGNVFRGGASMWIGTEDDWQEVERTF